MILSSKSCRRADQLPDFFALSFQAGQLAKPDSSPVPNYANYAFACPFACLLACPS
jgi:hypothetical protein